MNRRDESNLMPLNLNRPQHEGDSDAKATDRSGGESEKNNLVYLHTMEGNKMSACAGPSFTADEVLTDFSVDGFVTEEEVNNTDHTTLRYNNELSDFIDSDLTTASVKLREERKRIYDNLQNER